ncbi:MAG: winged helix-turn-helix domain-containing protein [Atribacterota bacterium]
MGVEDLFKALSCRWRVAIIKMVAEQPLCQCEIERVLPIDKTNLSRHVKALRMAGIIEEKVEGPAKRIYLKEPQVLKILALAEAISGDTVRVREEEKS